MAEGIPFEDRILDILLGSEDVFGSGRAAAAEFGIARSTFNDIVSGATQTISQSVIDKVTEYFQGEGPGVTSGVPGVNSELLSAADLFTQEPPGEKQALRVEFRNDPAFYKSQVKQARDVYQQSVRERAEQGKPPLEGSSP